jgi:hypothetical protein
MLRQSGRGRGSRRPASGRAHCRARDGVRANLQVPSLAYWALGDDHSHVPDATPIPERFSATREYLQVLAHFSILFAHACDARQARDAAGDNASEALSSIVWCTITGYAIPFSIGVCSVSRESGHYTHTLARPRVDTFPMRIAWDQ